MKELMFSEKGAESLIQALAQSGTLKLPSHIVLPDALEAGSEPKVRLAAYFDGMYLRLLKGQLTKEPLAWMHPFDDRAEPKFGADLLKTSTDE